jgi:LmbE family N-acetylglucosaminyl deacetylase
VTIFEPFAAMVSRQPAPPIKTAGQFNLHMKLAFARPKVEVRESLLVEFKCHANSASWQKSLLSQASPPNIARMNQISRRNMLGQAGLLGGAIALGLPAADALAANEPGQTESAAGKKLKIIVAGGHPGDPEYGCGGTIALYAEAGHDVVILYLNKGEGGASLPSGSAPDRVAEAAKACQILKARPLFAGQIDAKSIIDNDRYDQFRRIIEAEKPNIVLTQWPIDNHRDHRATALLTYDAWLQMGKTFALYYYEVSNGEDTMQFAPTHYVDITSVADRKRAACYAHASQAPDKFFALQELVNRMRGLENGSRLAEAYIRQVQSPRPALPE